MFIEAVNTELLGGVITGCQKKSLLSSYCGVACQAGKRESFTLHRSQLQLTWFSQ